MPNFADKVKDKSIDLQNFGLRSDLYNKKNLKVRTRVNLTTRNVFSTTKINEKTSLAFYLKYCQFILTNVIVKAIMWFWFPTG